MKKRSTEKAPQRIARKPFLSDVKALRKRAREHILEGAVTGGYGGEPKAACKLLNDALATEIVCVLRYRLHYFMAEGIHAGPVKQEFLEHADDLSELLENLPKQASI